MPLFKYVTLDRIDILVNQEIRYTQLGEFNDPFEMPVFMEPTMSVSTRERREREVFLKNVRDEYEKLPDGAKKIMPLTEFLEEALKNKPTLSPPVVRIIEEFRQEAWTILKKAYKELPVLALTEAPDNLLMWSHYSGKHTGIVIEFDEANLTFIQMTSPTDIYHRLRKVIYSEIRPIFEAVEEYSSADVMLTKSIEWAYEKEWRIAKPAKEAQKTIPAFPYDICLFDMPATAIKRVILGARVSSEDVDRIRNIIRSIPHLRHIRLQQASLDERRFALNFSDCE